MSDQEFGLEPGAINGAQKTRWPWWRIAACAVLPWAVIVIVLLAHGPAWAAFGFGINTMCIVLTGAALGDAIAELVRERGAFMVEPVRAIEIRSGDVVWAPDDGDWLKVTRYEDDSEGSFAADEVTVYRFDGSEATFDADKNVLRRVRAGDRS